MTHVTRKKAIALTQNAFYAGVSFGMASMAGFLLVLVVNVWVGLLIVIPLVGLALWWGITFIENRMPPSEKELEQEEDAPWYKD